MPSQKLLVAALVVASSLALAGAAAAQVSVDPSSYSSHQYIDTESPTVQPTPSIISFRPDLRLMGLTMFWSQLVWAPASPMHLPATLAVVGSGDRRWGLR